MRLFPYTKDTEAQWDEFIPQTAQGMFVHTRRFLS